MTREELRENICGMTHDDMFEYIYELENRTCENCKSYIKATYGGYKNMCSFGIDIRMTPTSSFSGTPPNFGCNKFERKIQ